MAHTRQWKKPNWYAVYDWCKRIGGLIAVVAVSPAAREAIESGDAKKIVGNVVVPAVGAILMHQSRRFGDIKKIKRLEAAAPNKETTP